MQADHKTNFGTIMISAESIAFLATKAALSCYGVVDIAPRPSIATLFSKPTKEPAEPDGVLVKKGPKGYEVSLYLYLAYGLKITEIVSEVQKRVKYELKKTFQIPFAQVNVYVVDVKDTQKKHENN